MKRALFILALAFSLVPTFAQTTKLQAKIFPASNPNVYLMEEGFVDAHGVLIYYKIVGHGAPLMIVHGAPRGSHDYLLPYPLPFPRSNPLILHDYPSSRPSAACNDRPQHCVHDMVS